MTKGSYDFDSLHDPGFQVERLRQQAAVVRQLEADILRSAGCKLIMMSWKLAADLGITPPCWRNWLRKVHCTPSNQAQPLLPRFRRTWDSNRRVGSLFIRPPAINYRSTQHRLILPMPVLFFSISLSQLRFYPRRIAF